MSTCDESSTLTHKIGSPGTSACTVLASSAPLGSAGSTIKQPNALKILNRGWRVRDLRIMPQLADHPPQKPADLDVGLADQNPCHTIIIAGSCMRWQPAPV
jgi:hypothetical protein